MPVQPVWFRFLEQPEPGFLREWWVYSLRLQGQRQELLPRGQVWFPQFFPQPVFLRLLVSREQPEGLLPVVFPEWQPEAGREE